MIHSFVFDLDDELCRFVMWNEQQSVYGWFVCWAEWEAACCMPVMWQGQQNEWFVCWTERGRMHVICWWHDMDNKINGLCADGAGKNACCMPVMWYGQQNVYGWFVCWMEGGAACCVPVAWDYPRLCAGRVRTVGKHRPRSPRITGDERLSPGNRTGRFPACIFVSGVGFSETFCI